MPATKPLRLLQANHPNVSEILRLVGLDPRQVVEATIHLGIDQVVTVDAKLYGIDARPEEQPDGTSRTP